MRMKAVENEKKSCIKIEGNVSPFIEKYCNVREKRLKSKFEFFKRLPEI